MPVALLTLIGCQLLGEVARVALHLPVPGPVIGMFLLAAALAIRDRGRPPNDEAAPLGLQRVADALIGHMGLLFVPAGVGVIAQADLLREQWIPIVGALLGSTILSLAVTGLVMHWIARVPPARPAIPKRAPGLTKLAAR